MAADSTSGGNGLAPQIGAPRNLNQIINDNLGGLEASWYVPVEDVVSVPDPEEPIIEGDVVLKPGATWYQLVAAQNSLRFTEDGKSDRQGPFFQPKLTGTLAKRTGELAAGLEAVEGRNLLILHRDANGQVWLSGDLDEPLKWVEKADSGSSTSLNGTTFTLGNDTTRRSRCYRGQWAVSGGQLESGLVLQGAAGGTVQIRTAGGRLLATVAAGKTVVLKSGFKLSYQII